MDSNPGVSADGISVGRKLSRTVFSIESTPKHPPGGVRRIFDRLINSCIRAPHLSVSRILLYLLATFTSIAFLVPLATGLVVLFHAPIHVFSIIAVIALFGLAWLVRPRLASPPDNLVSRSACPALWGCILAVSQRLGVPPPDGLMIDGEFNAGVGRYGLAQRRIMTLGVPLMMALDKQERVALMAHEMSHYANGDPARSVIVSVTIDSLAAWYEALHPLEIWPRDSGEEFVVLMGTVLANLAMLVVSQVPRGLLWCAIHLHWDDSQIAEYRADRLAAQMSGRAAFERLLVKLSLGPYFDYLVQRNVLNRCENSLFSDLAAYVENLPPREFEKLRRLSELEKTSLDSTHPPTSWRRSMVSTLMTLDAGFELSDHKNRTIDEELECFFGPIERQLFDEYRSSLYA